MLIHFISNNCDMLWQIYGYCSICKVITWLIGFPINVRSIFRVCSKYYSLNTCPQGAKLPKLAVRLHFISDFTMSPHYSIMCVLSLNSMTFIHFDLNSHLQKTLSAAYFKRASALINGLLVTLWCTCALGLLALLICMHVCMFWQLLFKPWCLVHWVFTEWAKDT